LLTVIFYFFQAIDERNILGFDNYNEALNSHKLQLRGTDLGPSTESESGPVPTPGPVHLANILRDFVTDSDDSIEQEGTEDGDSNVESEPMSRRKAGHRYTEGDFGFLDEDWLRYTNETSEEDISDDVSDEISETD
jgi:hypothetical protein